LSSAAVVCAPLDEDMQTTITIGFANGRFNLKERNASDYFLSGEPSEVGVVSRDINREDDKKQYVASF
jgi:hypothetical protein